MRLAPWRSVRGRLLMLALAVETLMLTLLVGSSVSLLRDRMGEQAQKNAERLVPILKAALAAPLAQYDYATVQAVLDESAAVSSIDYLAVLDIHDNLVAQTGWPANVPLPPADPTFSLDQDEVRPRYDVAAPIDLSGQRFGTLRFGLDISPIVAARGRLLTQGVSIAAGELLLSAALLALLGWLITRQLSALMRASEEVAAGNATPAPVPEGNDDLGQLGAAFNRMSHSVAERIAQLTEAHDQLLRAKEAAESASRAKAAFLAAMSHEIRTPMNAILGMMQMALDARSPADLREHIRKAHLAAGHLLGIVNDILDFSKIEAGKLPIDRTAFDLRALAGELADVFAPLATEKGLHFGMFVAADVPPAVWGDPLRVRQILHNLIGNALKFTSAGSVEVALEAVSADSDRHYRIRGTVRDTGVGIAPEDRGQLFAPFTQADASTTRRYGGTGLGLAICKRLAKAMGGEIDLVSAPGAGSVFWFELPFDAAPVDAIERPVPAMPRHVGSLAGRRILLVEDNRLNQEVALHFLRKVGIETVVAENGAQALDIVAGEAFDLVLMDCQMPVMDGYEAAKRLRASGHGLPILAMTANALAGDRERSLEAGMNDHLTKPIVQDVLYSALTRWLAPDAATMPSGDTGTRCAADVKSTVAEPVIDSPTAIANLAGDEDLYREVVRLFLVDVGTQDSTLEIALTAGDLVSARRVAHTVKGTAASVGAGALHAAAFALEKACAAGDALDAPWEEFRRRKEDAVAALKGYLASAT